MSDENVIQAYTELVEHLVAPLIGDHEFKIKSKVRGNTIHLELDAPGSVRGRLIGRGGRMARSLRTIVETASIPTDKKVSFDISD